MFPGLHSPVFEFLVLAFTLASSRIQFIDVPVSGCFKDLQRRPKASVSFYCFITKNYIARSFQRNSRQAIPTSSLALFIVINKRKV